MGKLRYITLLRVFSILVVVFFHCYQMLFSGHIAEVKGITISIIATYILQRNRIGRYLV